MVGVDYTTPQYLYYSVDPAGDGPTSYGTWYVTNNYTYEEPVDYNKREWDNPENEELNG
jgi:hypothetical protein